MLFFLLGFSLLSLPAAATEADPPDLWLKPRPTAPRRQNLATLPYTHSLPTLTSHNNSLYQGLPIEQKMADRAVVAARVLSADQPIATGYQLLRDYTTHRSAQLLETALRPWGRATIKFSLDQDFTFKSSAADLLAPLRNRPQRLLFSQWGIRQINQQTIVNLGLGERHWLGDWMVGYNLFIDRTLPVANTRLGCGLEIWRDYLKLSANLYRGLSAWQASRRLIDYDEAPANGYDLRAQWYLTCLPQLGGQLGYEHYFGAQVALANPLDPKRSWKKNPHRLTLGINYSPCPLLTMGVEGRKGSGEPYETRTSVTVNYQLGLPWLKQLDPSQLARQRSLLGSRFDLVDRRYDMIVKYRKQVLIRLQLPPTLVGKEGGTLPITASIQSKYGLSHIVWQADSLLAAGGKMSDAGNGQYWLTLPAFQINGNNNYSLTALAYDSKGNVSEPANCKIIVTQRVFHKENSQFRVDKATLTANGREETNLQLLLRDEENQPVTHQAAKLAFTISPPAGFKGQLPPIGAIKESAPGIYQASLTANQLADIYTIQALIEGTLIKKLEVTLTDWKADLEKSAITLSRPSIVANGKATTTIRVTLKDAEDNLITTAKKVQLAFAGNALGAQLTPITDNGKGIYTATLTAGTQPGSLIVQATVDGQTIHSPPLTLSEWKADPTRSTIDLSRKTITANGTDTSTLTLTLLDDNGKPITTAKTVQLAFAGNDRGASLSAVADNRDGTYTATLTAGTQAGSLTVQATVDGQTINSPTLTLGEWRADKNNSTIDLSSTTLTANGTDTSTLTLTLLDDNGKPITTAKTVQLAFAGNDRDARLSAVADNRDGSYTATLTAGTQPGELIVTATVDGQTINSPTLTLGAWRADKNSSKFDLSSTTLTANGTDTSTLTLTLLDDNGKPITTAKTVQLAFAGNDRDARLSAVADNRDGSYTATLTAGTQPGELIVTATVDGQTINSPTLTLGAWRADKNSSKIDLSSTTLTANGTDTSTLTLTLLDDNGKPITTAKTVQLAFAGDDRDARLSAVADNRDGSYTATLTAGTQPGELIVTATVDGQTINSPTLMLDEWRADKNSSKIDLSSTTITANGTDTSTLTLTLLDDNGKPITTAKTVQLAFAGNDRDARLSAVADNRDGSYTATLTAGPQPGELIVTATVDGQTINSPTLMLDEWRADKNSSKIDLSSTTITANGTDTSTLTLTLKDEKGNLITTAQTVRLAFAGSDRGASLSPATDNKNGTYTATLTAETKPGKLTVQAFVNEQIVKQIPFTLSQWEVNATQSRIEVAPVSITAGEHSSITLTLRDDSGRLITSDRSAVLTLVGATFYPDGSAQKKITCRSGTGTAEITSTTVGQATITAQIGPVSLVPITLQVNPGAVVKVRLKVPTEPTVVGDPSQLMLFLKDNYGNLTTGGTVQGEITGLPGVSKSIDFIETQKKGVYKGTIESTIAGTANIKITVDGLSPPAKEITFIPGPPDATKSEIKALPPSIIANGQDRSTIMVTLRDSYSNLITPNQNITFSPI